MLLKGKKKPKKTIESYRSDLIYIASIEALAREQCPIVPLELPTGDEEKDNENFLLTIRSASENKGFIKGYEYAISTLKQLFLNAINDYERDVLEKAFYKLIEC